MYQQEKSAVAALGVIMAFRMLGLFMILPVFSVQATHLAHSTPFLIGMAIGIYGLTQACLQIPFGMLSDKFGRKPIITIGLIIFAIGSLIAATSTSIYGIILGRAIQGGGAIGSTCMAMIADLTRDENRSKAMAFVGMMIGFSFSIAIVLGPIINDWFHLSGIFNTTALLAILAIILLFTCVPTPPSLEGHTAVNQPKQHPFKIVLGDLQLVHLDISIFLQHAILTLLFIATPILLTQRLGMTSNQQVVFYLVIFSCAFVAMLPGIIVAEKKRKMKKIFLWAIALLLISQTLLALLPISPLVCTLMLFLFFTAFTLLEATLPSMVSKVASIHNRGAAMGVYSSSQFLGIFIGGILGGWVLTHFGFLSLFLTGALLALIWMLLSIKMKEPPYLSTLIFNAPNGIGPNAPILSQLQGLDGVGEIALIPAEGLIYIKADKKKITQNELRNQLEAGTL